MLDYIVTQMRKTNREKGSFNIPTKAETQYGKENF